MKKRMRKWGLIAILATVALSCKQKNDTLPMPDASNRIDESAEMTKLIRKLENPYSVTNMQKANDNLQKSNTRVATEGIDIITTHLYLKFKPKNNQELEILKDDSTLVLYSYPLDYEISQGSYFHDPAIPDSLPTYQYCSVPVNNKLPEGVEYEVLENLFIPDENKIEANANLRLTSDESITTLVDEALRITGNLDPVLPNARVTSSDWRPAGRIRVWDDVTRSLKGVEGVVVKARRWFTTHHGTVYPNGYYICDGTFKRDANYSLDWERYDFALREGWLDGANINGPKKEGNWDLDFYDNKNAFHAKVFMAANHYYYKNIKGLRRPPQNGTFKTQLHIRCHNESNSEKNGFHSPGRRFLGLGSAVHIYNQQIGSSSITIRDIYATTIHELAHASHWSINSSDYNNSEDKLSESWARGVQWELVRMVWTDYYGGATIPPNYTQVVVDMIDPNYSNQSANQNLGIWNDNVTNYTIRELEDALIGQTTWNGWKNNIKNKYNNATKNNLDALFYAWN